MPEERVTFSTVSVGKKLQIGSPTHPRFFRKEGPDSYQEVVDACDTWGNRGNPISAQLLAEELGISMNNLMRTEVEVF